MNPLLSPFHGQLINPTLLLLFIPAHVLSEAVVVLVLGDGTFVRLECAHLDEEALDDAREEVVVLVQARQDTEQVVVRQQTLLQTLVQEVPVRMHHIVDRIDITSPVEKPLLQLQEVWLQHLHRHVVDIVLAKVEHSVSKGEGMLLDA